MKTSKLESTTRIEESFLTNSRSFSFDLVALDLLRVKDKFMELSLSLSFEARNFGQHTKKKSQV